MQLSACIIFILVDFSKEMSFICFIIPIKVKTAMSELDVDFNDMLANSGVMLNIIFSDFSVMPQI